MKQCVLILFTNSLLLLHRSRIGTVFNIPPQTDGGRINQQFGAMKTKQRSRKRFSKNIHKIISAINKTNLQLPVKNLLMSEVIIYLKVFGARMEDRTSK